MDLSTLANVSTAQKTEAKPNSLSYPREDEKTGTEAEFELTSSILPQDKIQELLSHGILTSTKKETYCTLTLPRGSIMLNGVVLNGLRMQITCFAKAK